MSTVAPLAGYAQREIVQRVVAWRKALKLGDAASQLVVMAGEVGELFEAETPEKTADAIGDVAVTAICVADAAMPGVDLAEAAGVLLKYPSSAKRIVVAQGRLAEAIRKQQSPKLIVQLCKTIFVSCQDTAEEAGFDFWVECLNPVVNELERRLAEGMRVVNGTAIKKADHKDMVSSPPHYKEAARVECITILEDLGLSFHLGNAVKYLWRAGRKGDDSKTLEDIQKARWYVDREVELRGGRPWNPDERPALGNRGT